jgi:hypothetical protein
LFSGFGAEESVFSVRTKATTDKLRHVSPALEPRALSLFPLVCTGRVRIITWSLPCNLRMPSTCALESPLKFDLAGHFGGRERNLGVGLTFKNLRVHFVVATRVSAISGRSLHDYQAAGRAIGWIEVNGPTLKAKVPCTVWRVAACVKSIRAFAGSSSRVISCARSVSAFQQHKLKVRPITSEGLEGVSYSHSCGVWVSYCRLNRPFGQRGK